MRKLDDLSGPDRFVGREHDFETLHDGVKMTGKAYRVPCNPVAPGQNVADEDMCIIESMPVKSLITSTPSGAIHSRDTAVSIGGFAWAGDNSVASVDISIDFGQTWMRSILSPPANRLAWQRFEGAAGLGEALRYVRLQVRDNHGGAHFMALARVVFLV